MLSHCTAELKARARSVSGLRVLDIGCGTGETCAIWLDGGAEVTGVDVSAPMLAVATDRTGGKATLVAADASVWMGDALFDLAVSRFGLMSFDDPDAAFATIADNVRPDGRLLFTCWRVMEENQWVTTPMSAVQDLLPDALPPVPHAPGAFALADRDRLDGILTRAGFEDVTISPFDFPVCLASGGGVQAAARFSMQLGPAGGALAAASREAWAVAVERLKVALAPHDRGGLVTLGVRSGWLRRSAKAEAEAHPDDAVVLAHTRVSAPRCTARGSVPVPAESFRLLGSFFLADRRLWALGAPSRD